MRISACYMVKNEEQNLDKSLASVANVADEIVLVDTGSTDRTMEIAQEYGARIFQQEWQDNFSLHRNYALDQAAGDWIIFLDADEYFVNAEGLRDYLQRASKYPACEGLLLPLININPDTGTEQAEIISRARSLRIWRNQKNFRFTGCVHEMLYVYEENKMRPLNMIEAHEKFTLHHTGYRRKILRQKNAYYLTLLLREIEKYGEQPLSARYLADCYFGLEDYEQAAYYASRAISREQQLGVTTVAGFYKLYLYWLESGKKLHYSSEKMAQIAQKALIDTCNERYSQEMQNFIEDLLKEGVLK